MTAIADVKAVAELIAGKTIANAKLESIVEDFIQYDESMQDPLTNEQKAQMFLDDLKAMIKARVEGGSAQRQRTANEAAIQAAASTAAEDFV